MLSRRDYLVLHKCRKPYKPQTAEERAQINALYKAGLVVGHGQEIAPAGMPQIKAWVVTNAGLNALEEFGDSLRRERGDCIRYVITTTIAVLALIIAAVSLLAQLQIISLPVP